MVNFLININFSISIICGLNKKTYDFYRIMIYITKNANLKNKDRVLKTDRPSEVRRRLLN